MIAIVCTVCRGARQRKCRRMVLLGVLAILFAGPRPTAQIRAQPGPPGKKGVPSRLLEAFDALSASKRWQRIEAVAAMAFETTNCGDLVQTVVARGSLESAKPGCVVCSSRAPMGS